MYEDNTCLICCGNDTKPYYNYSSDDENAEEDNAYYLDYKNNLTDYCLCVMCFGALTTQSYHSFKKGNKDILKNVMEKNSITDCGFCKQKQLLCIIVCLCHIHYNKDYIIQKSGEHNRKCMKQKPDYENEFY